MKRNIARLRERTRNDEQGLTVMEVVVSAMLAILFAAMFFSAFSKIQENGKEVERLVEAGESTSPAPEAVALPAPPADPINWQPLVTTVAGLLILGAIIVGITLAVKQFNKHRLKKQTAQQQLEEQVQKWDSLRARYQKLLLNITSYETDLSLAIRYPAMNDMSEPTTAAMYEALEEVEGLMDTVNETGVGGDDTLFYNITDKVSALSTKYVRAEHHAQHIALSKMSDTDRKDFQQARQLLDQVSDPGNPEKMRIMYAERLKKVVNRINKRNTVAIIPASTVVELEKTFRPALPAADMLV